jgi:hypothetical protein
MVVALHSAIGSHKLGETIPHESESQATLPYGVYEGLQS